VVHEHAVKAANTREELAIESRKAVHIIDPAIQPSPGSSIIILVAARGGRA
jgi:hypothetical protein